MFSFVIALPVFMALCLARPQESAPPAAASAPRGGDSTPIPIVNQTEDSNPDGSFHFSFETGNGIKYEEKGYLKDGANASEKIQVIEGSVSYKDNEGNPINLKYIADENGYQPQGDHIPKAPEPQARALANGAAPIPQDFAAAQPAPQPEVAFTPAAETQSTNV